MLINPLRVLAASGRCAVVLLDALDEADEAHGINGVLTFLLAALGKANTGALSVVVTLRLEPKVKLRVLAHEYGVGQVPRLDPAALRAPCPAAAVSDARWQGALHAQSQLFNKRTGRLLLIIIPRELN